MHRTGTTTDNQPVIAGVASLTNTHGLPLELVLQYFRVSGSAAWQPTGSITWPIASRTGTIRIRSAPASRPPSPNVYGPQYKKEMAARLDLMFQCGRLPCGTGL
jgi:hypothetical protein